MAKKTVIKSDVTLKNYQTFINDDTKPKALINPEYYLKKYPFFKVLSDAMPCAIYILDYTTQKYVYVSESCKFITGYTSEEHMQMGQQEFYKQCVHTDDTKLYVDKIFKEFIETAKTISGNEIKNYRFSLNYRLNRKDGAIIKILQHSVVLETNSEGYPLLSLGILTDMTAHKRDNQIVLSVTHFDKEMGFKTISSNTFTDDTHNLTTREKEIIKHIIFGHNTFKIAELLNISVLTVNAHRRNINKKTNCKNVANLINFAMINGIT